MKINPMLYKQNLYNHQLNLQKTNSVNIDDCFEYNQQIEFFTGENMMFCSNCKKRLPASYQTTLYTSPEILVIFVNNENGIDNITLKFMEKLNLMNYVESKKNGYIYTLISLVTDIGESGKNRHLIAYCKSPIDNTWYKYNDDIVSKVINFKQDVIDHVNPNILFYQKKKE